MGRRDDLPPRTGLSWTEVVDGRRRAFPAPASGGAVQLQLVADAELAQYLLQAAAALDPERLHDCAQWDERDRIADLQLFGRPGAGPVMPMDDSADTLGDTTPVPAAITEAESATELRTAGLWIAGMAFVAGMLLHTFAPWVMP